MKQLTYKNKEGQKVPINFYKVNETDISQTTGQSTEAVMSQKAVTDELANKADKSETYTKTEIDNKIAEGGNFDSDQYYTKSEVDNALENVEAIKLKTPVTLWGNQFDGSKDVSGPIKASYFTLEGGHLRLSSGGYFYDFNTTKDGLSIGRDNSNDIFYNYATREVTFKKNITAPNITEIESKLEGVTKAADESEVIKYLSLRDLHHNETLVNADIPEIYFGDGLLVNTEEPWIGVDTNYIATREYVDDVKTSILGSDELNESYDTLQEVAEWIEGHSGEAADIISKQNAIEEWRKSIPDGFRLTHLINPPEYQEEQLILNVRRSDIYNKSISQDTLTFNAATSTTAGVMSAEDKVKLDSFKKIYVDASSNSLIFNKRYPIIAEEYESEKSSTDPDTLIVLVDSASLVYPERDPSQEEKDEEDDWQEDETVEPYHSPGIYLYDEETGLLYRRWADQDKYKEDGNWKLGYYYVVGNDLELYYGGENLVSIDNVVNSIEVNNKPIKPIDGVISLNLPESPSIATSEKAGIIKLGDDNLVTQDTNSRTVPLQLLETTKQACVKIPIAEIDNPGLVKVTKTSQPINPNPATEIEGRTYPVQPSGADGSLVVNVPDIDNVILITGRCVSSNSSTSLSDINPTADRYLYLSAEDARKLYNWAANYDSTNGQNLDNKICKMKFYTNRISSTTPHYCTLITAINANVVYFMYGQHLCTITIPSNRPQLDPVWYQLNIVGRIPTETNISNWDTAYSWGNHADAGYIKDIKPTYKEENRASVYYSGTSPDVVDITDIQNIPNETLTLWLEESNWDNGVKKEFFINNTSNINKFEIRINSNQAGINVYKCNIPTSIKANVLYHISVTKGKLGFYVIGETLEM